MSKLFRVQSRVRAFFGVSAIVVGGTVFAGVAPVVPSLAIDTQAVAAPPGPISAVQTVPPNLTWERTNPGGGGTIATVGATENGTIVAATDLSGVYRSSNDGASWQPLGSNQGLNNTHIASLGFHPTDGDTFYAGAWGIYKTTNLGDSFTHVLADGYIESMSFPAADEQIGYASYHDDWDTMGEVYKTTDGGNTWGPVAGENLPDIRVVKVLAHPLDASVVYALAGKSRWGCSDADLYRSIDGGVNWARIGSAYPSILDIDVDPTNTDNVFITTFDTHPCAPDQALTDYVDDTDTDGGALYRSSNGGTTWSELSTQTGIISVGANPQTILIMTVVWPYDWNLDAGTWRTADGGQNWTQTGHATNWTQGWITDQYFGLGPSFNGFNKTVSKDMFQPDRFLASFGSWAWASKNGGAQLDNISTDEISPNKWQSTGIDNVNGHGLAISASNPDVIYMGAYDIGLWTSLDRGDSWQRTQPSHLEYPTYVWSEGQGSNVTALVADPTIDGLLWAVFHREGFGNGPAGGGGTNSALFRSDDYGQTWTKNNSLPDAKFFYGLTIDPSSSAGARRMFMTVEGDVYRSTNDGVTWSKVLTQGGLKFTAVDSQDPDLVYAGGENGLYRSIDGGDNWTVSGLPEMSGPFVGNFLPTHAGWEGIFDVVADPVVADRVYVSRLWDRQGSLSQ